MPDVLTQFYILPTKMHACTMQKVSIYVEMPDVPTQFYIHLPKLHICTI